MVEVGARAEGVDAPRAVAAVRPRACVLGDTDLARPLRPPPPVPRPGRAGRRCAVVPRRDSPKAFSRFVDVRIDWADNWFDPEGLRANVLAFAAGEAVQPVLVYQYDGDLLFVSRNRDALAERFRFTIADADLIEQLVDKTRFRELAAERDLPVPPTVVVWPGAGAG